MEISSLKIFGVALIAGLLLAGPVLAKGPANTAPPSQDSEKAVALPSPAPHTIDDNNHNKREIPSRMYGEAGQEDNATDMTPYQHEDGGDGQSESASE